MNLGSGITGNTLNDFTTSYIPVNSSSFIDRITQPQDLNQDEGRKQISNQERPSYAEKVLSFTTRVNAPTETRDKDAEEVQDLLKRVSLPKEINPSVPNESALKELEDLSKKINPKLKRKHNLPPNLICVEFLGNGSYGKVYKVFDKTHRCFLAAKEPKSDLRHDKSFFRECWAHLQLLKPPSNPKLLTVIQVYEPDKRFCSVMEYGHGSLTDFCRFRKEKGLPWTDEDLVELYYQLVEQIDELKKMNICHRDIKPDNIIYSDQKFFKLTDFGFAEQVESVDIEQELSIAGTKGYWHPTIEKAASKGQKTCRIVPYEADLESIKKTINKILKNNKRLETIDDLLRKTARPNKEILSEKELNQYKIFLFEGFYQETTTLEEKFDKLQIFTEYCTYNDITTWMKEKLRNLADVDEARLVYFFAAKVLDLKGRHKKAIICLTKCEELSQESPDKLTASLYNLLGLAKCHLFDWDSCKDYHTKNLELKTDIYGDSSPEVAEECICLAFAEFILGNRDEVLSLFKRTLAIYQQKPEAISNSTVNMMAFLVTGLGRYEEAVTINRKLRDSTTESRGERHPSVAFIVMCLGAAYHRLGKTGYALAALEKSLKIHKETVELDHQHMTYFWFHSGEAFKESGDYEKAKTYFQQSLDLLNSKYRAKPLRFAVLIFIAELWIQRDENLNEAEEYLDECEENLEKIEHSDYYYAGVLWRAIGLLSQKKEDCYALALEKYQKSLESFQKLSQKNIWVASSLIQIAALHFKWKAYQKAEDYLLYAHSILSETLFQSHNLFIMCSFLLGQVYSVQSAQLSQFARYAQLVQEKSKKAKKYFTQARDMRRDLKSLGYPKSYPTIRDIQVRLDEINSEFSQGNYNAGEMANQIPSG